MSALFRRVRVVLTALPTWLGAVSLAAPIVAQQIATVFPHGAEHVVSVVVTAGGVATAAVTVIRRLTPVPADQQGLLPPEPPASNGPEGPVPGRLAGS
jgi:hypothetical protein